MSQSYSVIKISPLTDSTVIRLNDCEKENQTITDYETKGGTFSDTKHIWKSCGPRFVVSNSTTGIKTAAWTFGSIVKDFSAKVVCVDELIRSSGKLPLLIVGLECDVNKGMICIFDIGGSRVLRAIRIYDKITSIHVITSGNDLCPLPGPLRAFDGILSVGTVGGNVFLLDICRQTFEEGITEVRDELDPCEVKYLFMDDIDSLELFKQHTSKNGEHLAIHLNATQDSLHFTLKGPKGDDRVHVNRIEVTVSSLHYCPQLGSLLVGYNFGAWQLWNFINLQLVYTSSICENNIPVTHFAFQEPCDDPRAFCYIWAVYSNTELRQSGFPIAVLYSLNYKSKEFHEGYGILYQDLVSCTIRFQTELTLCNKGQSSNIEQGAHCLRLEAINKGISKNNLPEESHEEMINICFITWCGWSADSPSLYRTYLSVFDLNQWYKEQMPYSPEAKESECYISYTCLNEVLVSDNSGCLPFLDVRIDTNTITQFYGSQKLEEHYYPSSLAFQLCALSENRVVLIHNQGTQRAFLSHLENSGSMSLVKPKKLVQEAIHLGLVPLFMDISNNTMSFEYQWELLLTTALEHQLLGWLCRCASSWSTGSFSSIGCTLHSLLSWAWRRAQILKENADKLATPLFDYSGLRLDANAHNLLNNCVKQLKGLTTLFSFVTQKLLNFVYNPDVIKQQWNSLQMILLHLEVMQWLLNVGLLPECPLTNYPRIDEYHRVSAPYPVDDLIAYYNERRTSLQSLNNEQFSTSGSLLFIDNLIDLECGGHNLQGQWKSDRGNGLYPPPSLQSLLRTYLVENVKVPYKHCIIVYVFLDLAMTLNDSSYKPIITHLIKFPAVFQLNPSLIKITQGFWQLDHGDFFTAMEQLLDPLICAEDIKIWHHRVALKALLIQEQYKFALLYLQVRQPCVSEVQDLCTILSLYVANDMLQEAFHFQRQSKNSESEEKLLQHFYQECNKKGHISSVLDLPLTTNEEKLFMRYLKDVNHPNAKELQTFFYIQRSRYMDVLEQNDRDNLIDPSSKGLRGRENLSFSNSIIQESTESLPEISKTLMNIYKKEKNNLRKEVTHPEPFSVFIHNPRNDIKFKSSIVQAGFVKAKEIWHHSILDKSLRSKKSTSVTIEDVPFLSTPKVSLPYPRFDTQVIYPKIVMTNEDGPSPPKKLKLSSRSPLISPERQKISTSKNESNNSLCVNANVKFETPLIKRKVPKSSHHSDEGFSFGTPQSILKIRNLVHTTELSNSTKAIVKSKTVGVRNPNDSVASLHDVSTNDVDNLLNKKHSFGLTPRKSISRSSRHSVRFDVSSSSDLSTTRIDESTSMDVDTADVNIDDQTTTSKNSSVTTDDTFYSTDASPLTDGNLSKSIHLNANLEKDEKEEMENTNASEGEQDNTVIPLVQESIEIGTPEKLVKQTPRSRRSYKGLSPEVPVRSSPRLRKTLNFNERQTEESKKEVPEQNVLETSQSTTVEEYSLPLLSVPSSPSNESIPRRPNIKARQSLSRTVLENNTYIKITESSTCSLKVEHLAPFIQESESRLKSNTDTSVAFTEIVEQEDVNVNETKSCLQHNENRDDSLKANSSENTMYMPDMSLNFTCTPMDVDSSVKPLICTNETSPPKSPTLITELQDNNSDNDKPVIEFQQESEQIVPASEVQALNPDENVGNNSVNIYEDLSNDNYASVDPELNVFEVTDDLDLNEAVSMERGVNNLDVDINFTNNDAVIFENIEILSSVINSDYTGNADVNEQERHVNETTSTHHSDQVEPDAEYIETVELDSSSNDESQTEKDTEPSSANSETSYDSEDDQCNSSNSNRSPTSSETSNDYESDQDNVLIEEGSNSNQTDQDSSDTCEDKNSNSEVTIEEVDDSVNENLICPLETIQEEPEESDEVATSPKTESVNVSSEQNLVTPETKEGDNTRCAHSLDVPEKTSELPVVHELITEDISEGSELQSNTIHVDENLVLNLSEEDAPVITDAIAADILDKSVESSEISKKNVEETNTPAKRLTRSASLKSNTSIENLPKRRTRRSTSVSSSPHNTESLDIPITKRTRRSSASEIDSTSVEASSKNQNDLSKNAKQLTTKRRILRSSSVDSDADTTNDKKRMQGSRASSESKLVKIDEIKPARRKGRSNSTSTSVEEGKITRLSRSTRSCSREIDSEKTKIEEYSNTRRLTRRQADILKKTLSSSTGMAVDNNTLDSEVVNPQENDLNVTPPKAESKASPSRTKRTTKRPVQPESSGISLRTRQRSQSTDESLRTTQSTPPKLRKTRQSSRDSDDNSIVSNVSQTHSLIDIQEPVVTRLRKRSNSTSEGRGTITSSSHARTRAALAKSKLSSVMEEHNLKKGESSNAKKIPTKKSNK